MYRYVYIGVIRLARQISVSNEVYALLIEKKGKRSFSEVIKESLRNDEKTDIMTFAGALKTEKKTLQELKAKIAAEREANYGRPLK
jgi:predicted CopG family antitoxin